MGIRDWFKSSSSDDEHSPSALETALEDEYLYKYHVLISEELTDEEWTRIAERMHEINLELRKHTSR